MKLNFFMQFLLSTPCWMNWNYATLLVHTVLSAAPFSLLFIIFWDWPDWAVCSMSEVEFQKCELEGWMVYWGHMTRRKEIMLHKIFTENVIFYKSGYALKITAGMLYVERHSISSHKWRYILRKQASLASVYSKISFTVFSVSQFIQFKFLLLLS